MFVNSAVEMACRDEDVDAKAVGAFEKWSSFLWSSSPGGKKMGSSLASMARKN